VFVDPATGWAGSVRCSIRRRTALTGNSGNEVALQRVIRLTAGETVTPLQLAPHDMSYTVGADRCYPCRLIRVVNPSTGTLHVSLTWTESRAILNLWANGQRSPGTYPELMVDVPVNTGEVVLYVGMVLPAAATGSDVYVPFKLATTRP